jgi:hypothetical protein
MNHKDKIDEIMAAIMAVYDKVDIHYDGPTHGGIWFLDIRRGNGHVNLEVKIKDWPDGKVSADYGFTIMDEDEVPFTGPDCSFGHLPTLIQYLKIILP